MEQLTSYPRMLSQISSHQPSTEFCAPGMRTTVRGATFTHALKAGAPGPWHRSRRPPPRIHATQGSADIFPRSIGRRASTGPNALRPRSPNGRPCWIDSRDNRRQNPGPIKMLGGRGPQCLNGRILEGPTISDAWSAGSSAVSDPEFNDQVSIKMNERGVGWTSIRRLSIEPHLRLPGFFAPASTRQTLAR